MLSRKIADSGSISRRQFRLVKTVVYPIDIRCILIHSLYTLRIRVTLLMVVLVCTIVHISITKYHINNIISMKYNSIHFVERHIIFVFK